MSELTEEQRRQIADRLALLEVEALVIDKSRTAIKDGTVDLSVLLGGLEEVAAHILDIADDLRSILDISSSKTVNENESHSQKQS